MERAYDQAKYGEFSRRPYIDMVIPTLTDPSVAPPGKHILSCFVQYAPYKLRVRHVGRAARRVRRRGRRHDRRARAEHPRHHPAPAGADAARSRARVRADRRQHLSGRADARSAVLPASGAGMGAVHDADPRICGCADRRRIPAAASWARRAAMRRCGSWEQNAADATCSFSTKARVTKVARTNTGRYEIILVRSSRPSCPSCVDERSESNACATSSSSAAVTTGSSPRRFCESGPEAARPRTGRSRWRLRAHARDRAGLPVSDARARGGDRSGDRPRAGAASGTASDHEAGGATCARRRWTGAALTLWRDAGARRAEIRAFSREDAERYPRFLDELRADQPRAARG